MLVKKLLKKKTLSVKSHELWQLVLKIINYHAPITLPDDYFCMAFIVFKK